MNDKKIVNTKDLEEAKSLFLSGASVVVIEGNRKYTASFYDKEGNITEYGSRYTFKENWLDIWAELAVMDNLDIIVD